MWPHQKTTLDIKIAMPAWGHQKELLYTEEIVHTGSDHMLVVFDFDSMGLMGIGQRGLFGVFYLL